jgi:hypothetical protein
VTGVPVRPGHLPARLARHRGAQEGSAAGAARSRVAWQAPPPRGRGPPAGTARRGRLGRRGRRPDEGSATSRRPPRRTQLRRAPHRLPPFESRPTWTWSSWRRRSTRAQRRLERYLARHGSQAPAPWSRPHEGRPCPRPVAVAVAEAQLERSRWGCRSWPRAPSAGRAGRGPPSARSDRRPRRSRRGRQSTLANALRERCCSSARSARRARRRHTTVGRQLIALPNGEDSSSTRRGSASSGSGTTAPASTSPSRT